MTEITLKEFFEHCLDELEKRLMQRFDQDAVAKDRAFESMEKRLDGFPNMFARKDDLLASQEEIANLKQYRDTATGKSAQTVYIIGFTFLVVQIALQIILKVAFR